MGGIMSHHIHGLLFSHSVMSSSLRPHGPQHARLCFPSPSPRVCSNSCPLSWWCRSTISSSVVPFSSDFNLSQHQGIFQWLSSLHPVDKLLEFQLQRQSFQRIFMLISFMLDRLDLLAVQGTLKSLLQHHSSKASILWHSAFFIVQLSTFIHDYWKNHSFD